MTRVQLNLLQRLLGLPGFLVGAFLLAGGDLGILWGFLFFSVVCTGGGALLVYLNVIRAIGAGVVALVPSLRAAKEEVLAQAAGRKEERSAQRSLAAYVQRAAALGVPRDSIEQHLADVGWASADIAAAFTAPPLALGAAQARAAGRTSSRKVLAILGIIIIGWAVLSGLSSFFAFGG